MSKVLTDEELRRKLLLYETNVPPITTTTRDILLQKLKMHESGMKPPSPSLPRKRRSLASPVNFSSDESETEFRGSASATVRRNRRSRGRDEPPFEESSPTASSIRPRPSMRRSLGGSTSSQSPLPPPRHIGISPRGRANALETDSDDSSDGNRVKTKVSPTDSYSSGGGVKMTLRSTSRRSSLGSSKATAEWHSHGPLTSTPSKLLSVQPTSTTPSPQLQQQQFVTPNHDFANHFPKTNGHSDRVSSDGLPSLIDAEFRTTEDLATHNSNSSQCVSMVLLLVAALFFVAVGTIYLGFRQKDTTLSLNSIIKSTSDDYMVCDADAGGWGSEYDCIPGSKVPGSLNVAAHIKVYLRKRAGDFVCNALPHITSARMHWTELAKVAKRLPDSEEIRFSYILLLFSKNPHWGVKLLLASGEQTFDPSDDCWLEAAVPEMSTSCQLKEYARSILYEVTVISSGCASIVGVAAVTYYLWSHKRKEKEMVFAFVEKVIAMLQQHYELSLMKANLHPYLAIPHIRDFLVPPSERRKKLKIWEKAVHFINTHESRIRLENQIVEGEEFPVWRWLPPSSPESTPVNTASQRKTKVWQGQAFENLDGGVNSLPTSPTPCLKIRNMFDPEIEYEDNWHLHIQDAILEKCTDGMIVHLKVDTSSREGCVFLKCIDAEAAGRAYKELHGWWFDGKLVTVKFLRLERYYDRFPEAANYYLPLRPCTVINNPVGNRAANCVQ